MKRGLEKSLETSKFDPYAVRIFLMERISPLPFYFVATIHLSRWAAVERSWGQRSSRAKEKADSRVREPAMWKVK